MWTELKGLEKAGVILMLIAAIVDIVQFSWILKSALKSTKNRLYNRIRKEILLEHYQRGESGTLKIQTEARSVFGHHEEIRDTDPGRETFRAEKKD